MKDQIAALLKIPGLKKEEIEKLIEVPKDNEMGDYALPCFSFAKILRKNPVEIAKDIANKAKSKEFERIEAINGYVNFFIDRRKLAKEVLENVKKQKENYGRSNFGKNKTVVVEFSSPNIAKPFHIGHLRSTIIGNSISKICEFSGFKVKRINYLGDWGTQFGKLIVGYKKFGSEKKLKENPIHHLLEIYVKANNEEYEDEAREWFKKLEDGNKEALEFWKKFKSLSLEKFDEIYDRLGVRFDIVSGESYYNKEMSKVERELGGNGLLELNEGAQIVDLERYGLGVVIVRKSDGATLYITRDLAAAIDRFKKFKFQRMIYEVGAEQKLHFKQLFKILELMGYEWAKNCVHVDHGLYLDSDGKKFATRKGKAVFMEDIFTESEELAERELKKRSNLSKKELDERKKKIALAAILYGDLKNYRSDNVVFDIGRFISFEGDTGPYLLYSYARAKSILKKVKNEGKIEIREINDKEKRLINSINNFPEVVKSAYDHLSPNLIANYAYSLSQEFNEFYHENRVIDSENERFRLAIVYAFTQTLSNALYLLGVKTIEEM